MASVEVHHLNGEFVFTVVDHAPGKCEMQSAIISVEDAVAIADSIRMLESTARLTRKQRDELKAEGHVKEE